MGKRRIRNLLKLGYANIVGFDLREDRRIEARKKYHIITVSNFQDALKMHPKIMIISTPPDLHKKYSEMAIKNNIHFFTEVNLSSKDVKTIITLMKGKSIIGVPSCTMRFHPVIKTLKELLDKNSIGKILTIYHHFGHYLPDWHPWEDYRNFYASKKETGGAREIIPFELVWMFYLFTDVKSVYGEVQKLSNLETDIDDVYQTIIEFKNKIFCTSIIDVITKPSIRETKVIGDQGVIICDFNSGLIKINNGERWKTIKIRMGKIAKGYTGSTPPEELYEEEMAYFLDNVKKIKKYPHSFSNELKILKVLDAIEKSNIQQKKLLLY